MRHFGNKIQETIYRSFLFNPPTQFIEHRGYCYRKTGAGVYFPFWVGYDHPDRSAPFVKESAAYASWAAGVDYRRLGGRDYPKNR